MHSVLRIRSFIFIARLLPSRNVSLVLILAKRRNLIKLLVEAFHDEMISLTFRMVADTSSKTEMCNLHGSRNCGGCGWQR